MTTSQPDAAGGAAVRGTENRLLADPRLADEVAAARRELTRP
jgi:hypothetical protein